MASRGWAKNKKGHLVNSEGKTARQVKQEKYAAKKADAKARASSGGGGGGASTGEATNQPAKYSLKSNVYIPYGGGVATYYYLVNDKGQQLDKATLKPYNGKDFGRYGIKSKSEAETYLQKINDNSKSLEKTGVGIILSSDKPKPNTFVKATVVIPAMGKSRNDPLTSMEIEGKVLGDYIVHKATTGFTGKFQVTHIKSGLAVTWKKDLKLNTEKDGQEIVRKLIKSGVKLPNRFNINLSREEAGKLVADINKAVES